MATGTGGFGRGFFIEGGVLACLLALMAGWHLHDQRQHVSEYQFLMVDTVWEGYGLHILLSRNACLTLV